MSDYFIDFGAATNGNGSTSSPWNRFTSAEHTSIVGGDNLWFRRFSPGNNINLITWLMGTDDSNRINYIGWPYEGDQYYDVRASALRSVWDLDATTYLYQRFDTSSAAVATLPSNITIHRFRFDNYKNLANSGNGRVVDIISQANISFFNSYMYIPNYTPTVTNYTFARTLRVDDSTNIYLESSTINQGNPSGTRSNMPCIFYINDSSVDFLKCVLYLGENNNNPFYNSDEGLNDNTSLIINSTLNFVNTTFHFRYNASYMSSTGEAQSKLSCLYLKDNAHVTVSGCDILHDNTYDRTDRTLPSYPLLASFKVAEGTFEMYDTEITTSHRNYTLIRTVDDLANITVKRCSWTVYDRPCNIFIEIQKYNSITISDITSELFSSTDYVYYNNFFLGFSNLEHLKGQGIHIENIDYMKALDLCRTNNGNVTVDVDNGMLKYLDIHFTTVASFTAENVPVGGVSYFYQTVGTTSYLRGGTPSIVTFNLKNVDFTGHPLKLTTNGSTEINANILYNNGNNTAIVNKNNYVFNRLKLVASRNTNFSELGELNASTYVEGYSMINSYDHGATSYYNNNRFYSTSPANRTGGAGYSVKLLNSQDDGKEMTYPKVFEDTTWIHVTASGTYNVIGYFATTTVSGAGFIINDGDISLTVDVINKYPEEFSTSILTIDDTSTWNNITPNAMYKVTNVISVDKEQYCPVRVHYFRKNMNSALYFDPKLEVISV